MKFLRNATEQLPAAVIAIALAYLCAGCGGSGASPSTGGGGGSGSATVTWDAVTSTYLKGYRVYYGTSSGNYLQSFGQGLDVGNATNYTVTGLSSGTTYYFVATAYDSFNSESAYSIEGSKTIP